MAGDKQPEFTPEELVAELRARERARIAESARAGRAFDQGEQPAAKAAPTGVVARFHKLDEIPSGELAKRAVALQRSIYGVDDRKDIFEVKDRRARPLINASLALVERADLHKGADGQWTLKTSSYKNDYALCSSETFASQPLGCFCSGVRSVGPDVVATAGHCVKSTADLDHIRFVFGFRMEDAVTPRTLFPDDDVYVGKEVIGRKYTADRTDWALVRLDRPVVGRRPVPFRASGKVKNAEPLFVVGHPCGLPQKMAGDAEVRNNGPVSYFVANLDTYGGNSGSPVFSGKSYALEGLLVRGQKDFVSTGPCYVSLTYPTTGPEGEDVTRTTEWTAVIKKAGVTGTARKPGKRKRTRKPDSTDSKNRRRMR